MCRFREIGPDAKNALADLDSRETGPVLASDFVLVGLLFLHELEGMPIRIAYYDRLPELGWSARELYDSS